MANQIQTLASHSYLFIVTRYVNLFIFLYFEFLSEWTVYKARMRNLRKFTELRKKYCIRQVFRKKKSCPKCHCNWRGKKSRGKMTKTQQTSVITYYKY